MEGTCRGGLWKKRDGEAKGSNSELGEGKSAVSWEERSLKLLEAGVEDFVAARGAGGV